jgi:hypothetical protein
MIVTKWINQPCIKFVDIHFFQSRTPMHHNACEQNRKRDRHGRHSFHRHLAETVTSTSMILRAKTSRKNGTSAIPNCQAAPQRCLCKAWRYLRLRKKLSAEPSSPQQGAEKRKLPRNRKRSPHTCRVQVSDAGRMDWDRMVRTHTNTGLPKRSMKNALQAKCSAQQRCPHEKGDEPHPRYENSPRKKELAQCNEREGLAKFNDGSNEKKQDSINLCGPT